MAHTHARQPHWLYTLILLLPNAQSRHSVPCFSLLSQRYLYRSSEDCPLAVHRYPQIPWAHDQPSMAAALPSLLGKLSWAIFVDQPFDLTHCRPMI